MPSVFRVIPLLIAAGAVAHAQRPVEDESVLQYVQRTISWYRDVAAAGGTGNLRESGIEALRSAFQFARAAAAFPAAKTPGGAATDNSRSRNLMQAEAAAEARAETLESRIKDLDRELETAPARLRPSLAAKRGKLEGDLNLAKARRVSLRSLIGVMNGADTGLSGKLDDLEHSVPELLSTAKAPGADPAAAQVFRPDAAGIVGLTTELFSLSRRMNRINGLAEAADELLNTNNTLRGPLRTALREVIKRGDAIALMPDTADPDELAATRKELDTLLGRFKLLSAVSAPLSQGASALNASRAGLLEWRGVLGAEYSEALRYLLIRLAMLGVAVLVIFLLSEMWRRGTIRYVQDLRRRRQVLLLRRIVVGFTVALFVILSFVTEFGSIATVFGFSAAGIALALQSVLLSVVAYFFLVGRWGVRVGDRVTVSGVTGDVIEIGLFRMHLMEVAGIGLDRHATGRIVVFPNAVFFQPSALFKQFPGLEYTWCTVSVALAPESDYALVESRLLAAVESIYAEYREPIERQYRAAQSSLNLPTDLPRPESRLRFVDSRLEFAVHYPVEIRRAAEFEDRVTRELVSAIEKEPRLKLAAGAAPKFQTAAGD